MVKRYSMSSALGMMVEDGGAWVKCEDYAALQAENERLKSEAGYTAADVATAEADGFRDGVRSVDLEQFRRVATFAMDHGGGELFDSASDLLALIDAHKGE